MAPWVFIKVLAPSIKRIRKKKHKKVLAPVFALLLIAHSVLRHSAEGSIFADFQLGNRPPKICIDSYSLLEVPRPCLGHCTVSGIYFTSINVVTEIWQVLYCLVIDPRFGFAWGSCAFDCCLWYAAVWPFSQSRKLASNFSLSPTGLKWTLNPEEFKFTWDGECQTLISWCPRFSHKGACSKCAGRSKEFKVNQKLHAK